MNPNEDILWDDDYMFGGGMPLAPVDKIMLGSRFEGVNINDIPYWLKTLVKHSSVLNITGTLLYYTGVEGDGTP
jgi:hypothetical protein